MRTWGGAGRYGGEAQLFLPREDVVALRRFAIIAAGAMLAVGALVALVAERMLP